MNAIKSSDSGGNLKTGSQLWRRLMFYLICVLLFLFVAFGLPRIAALPVVKQRVLFQAEKGINGNATFYTDLELPAERK